MTDNQQLLADYVQTGSETAFREVVARYVGLVYSTALRLVSGDSHRAQDVAQTVFVDLARQARTLSTGVRLGGWLHRHTCFVAVKTMRGERRRQNRERQAAEMNALQDNPADFSLVAPILDEAINELGEADRAAVLLRFYEQRDFRAVGAALGSNEDAARMRVTRALEKLASLLARRGVTTSAGALAVTLSANAVQAVPAGLAAAISTSAALAGTTLAATTASTIKTIVMTNIQKTFIVAALATPVLTGIYEYTRSSRLRDQARALEEEQAPFAAQINDMVRQKEDAMKRLEAAREEDQRLQRDVTELHKLRGQVAQGQTDSAELARLKAAAPEPETKLRTWVNRAVQLKQRFEQMPDQGIPELQFVTDQDWLDAVEKNPLDTETDCRQAMSRVRDAAEQKFAGMASKALKQYAQANSGQLPPDLSRLKPYFDPPVGDAILERFEIVPADKAGKLANPGDKWLILQKFPVDEEYDMRWMIVSGGGCRGTGDIERWTNAAKP